MSKTTDAVMDAANRMNTLTPEQEQSMAEYYGENPKPFPTAEQSEQQAFDYWYETHKEMLQAGYDEYESNKADEYQEDTTTTVMTYDMFVKGVYVLHQRQQKQKPEKQESKPKRLSFDDIKVGGVYYSESNREHYKVVSSYNDSDKGKIYRCNKWNYKDNKRSDKKTMLIKNDVEGSFFKESTKGAKQ